EALREAFASLFQQRGLKHIASAANVHVGCGVTHALFCAARAVLDPGDEVLVTSPYWPLIPGLLQSAGIQPVEVPLSFRLYQEPDLDVAAALEAAITEKTRAVYFISPGNPDGQIYRRDQIEAIAEVARSHDLWVLADEVYADFVYDGEHNSIATLPEMADRTITTYSLSKGRALAGARVGCVAGSERAITAALRIHAHTVYNVPTPMQRAGLFALSDGGAWPRMAKTLYREARDATAAALREIGIETPLPPGGTFFFLDLTEQLAGRPLQGMIERAIDEGVYVAPGRAFGAGYDNFVRLCYTGVPLDQILEGIRRLGRAMEAFG
ncbi:MAG: pyridoxal phosphate-dependent aminotransferase, partial [Deltaproteobacteria bacterium]|nr:pyridoxal phosphate-dependent aminotransferase [Deltaproteobacteria bacterium]